MKKKTLIIAILFFLGIYLLIFFLTFKNEIFEKRYVYLILDNQKNYLYNKDGFTLISNEKIEDLNYLYDIYIDGQNIGKYKLQKGEIWNLFDKNNNYKYYDEYFLGIYGDYPISVDNPKKRNLNLEEIKMLKEEYDINLESDIITGTVYETFLDNDDVKDKIIISTYNEIGENPNNFYNLVIVKINDNTSILINSKGEQVNCDYDVKSIFRLGNDKYQTLVLEKIENNNGDEETYSIENSIYQFSKKEYQKI